MTFVDVSLSEANSERQRTIFIVYPCLWSECVIVVRHLHIAPFTKLSLKLHKRHVWLASDAIAEKLGQGVRRRMGMISYYECTFTCIAVRIRS